LFVTMTIYERRFIFLLHLGYPRSFREYSFEVISVL